MSGQRFARPPVRPGARRLVAAAVAIAVALAVTACGISEDSSPRALAVTTSTTEPPSTPTSGGTLAVLWFVKEGNLVPVTRSLPDRRPSTVISALLDGPGAGERVSGVSTSIPTGTELRGVELDGTTRTLQTSVSRAFENVVGPAKQLAIAQLVLTATELSEVDDARFVVGSQSIQVPSPTRGDTAVVDDCDYRSLLPTDTAARELGLSGATLEILRARRVDLAQSCPATPEPN